MAPYFAERVWQKLFPYLVNTQDKTWLVGKQGTQVCAFSSFENGRRGIEIGEIYGIDEAHWTKIANLTLRTIKNEASYTLYTDIRKNDTHQYTFFLNKGFEVYKETVNYIFLKRSDDWKQRAYKF